MKKILIGTVVLAFVSTIASADWVKGEVAAIQPYDNSILINIKQDDGTVSRCFIEPNLSTDAQKSILAVALTAQSQEKKVWMLWNGNWNSIFLCSDDANCEHP